MDIRFLFSSPTRPLFIFVFFIGRERIAGGRCRARGAAHYLSNFQFAARRVYLTFDQNSRYLRVPRLRARLRWNWIISSRSPRDARILRYHIRIVAPIVFAARPADRPIGSVNIGIFPR